VNNKKSSAHTAHHAQSVYCTGSFSL